MDLNICFEETGYKTLVRSVKQMQLEQQERGQSYL